MKRFMVFLFLSFVILTAFTKYLSGRTTSNDILNTKKITLLPLGNKMPDQLVKNIYSEIKKFVPNISLDVTAGLPPSAYYKPRNRYRADSLIKWMSTRAKSNEVIMGITTVDISTTKGKYQDWGVMGLAYKPGNAGVASSYRLKNKSAFWKIVIHELGHTAGLPHCSVKSCFMRDAEGGDHTGEEKEFCSKCKKTLVNNGWLL
jgi:archaemetzincin